MRQTDRTCIKAELVLASKNSVTGTILYTLELVYPRMILAEYNTHRMFSRNTASSRAVPGKKQRFRVWHDPFVPDHIGANRPGMQAGAELEGWGRLGVVATWRALRFANILGSWIMEKLGAHKQIASRVLEPWMWVQQVSSMTDVKNFLKLRNHDMAEPHFEELAFQMGEIVRQTELLFNFGIVPPKGSYQMLSPGEWHLPYVVGEDRELFESIEDLKAISAGRCARVSFYLPEEGERSKSPERDVKRSLDLAANGHWSPLEHVATPLEKLEYCGNFLAWKQWRKFFDSEDGGDRPQLI